VNARRVAALLRELAAELEATEDAPANDAPAERPKRIPRSAPPKTTAEDHARATRALQRAGVYAAGSWKK
jgi:hypothetical protein